MNLNKKTRRFRVMTISVMLLTFALGCFCLPGGLMPTPIHSSVPTATMPPPMDTLAPVTGGALNDQGPWLLIDTDQGLWAANPDRSGLTQLTTIDYWNGSLQGSVQPGDNQVAFISPGNFNFRHMALNLLSLPEGNVTKITGLTSAQAETYADSGPGDSGFEALRAVGEQKNLAWSPDGTRLAFGGAMDGPSAEIYLYEIASSKIHRVSKDEAQDFSPSWSPDGNHLLYLGAEGFGTGAGMVMSGVWVAAGDGSSATLLYKSERSGEEIVGWLNDTTAILDS